MITSATVGAEWFANHRGNVTNIRGEPLGDLIVDDTATPVGRFPHPKSATAVKFKCFQIRVSITFLVLVCQRKSCKKRLVYRIDLLCVNFGSGLICWFLPYTTSWKQNTIINVKTILFMLSNLSKRKSIIERFFSKS